MELVWYAATFVIDCLLSGGIEPTFLLEIVVMCNVERLHRQPKRAHGHRNGYRSPSAEPYRRA